jgi:hypothetical protein
MVSREGSLEEIEIATPCSVPWELMRGDDRIRFCDHCQLQVYNLSGMTRRQADSLISKQEKRMCVRLLRRPDGTVLTKDCGGGFQAIQRRAERMFTRIAAIFAWLTMGAISTGCVMSDQGSIDPPLRNQRPTSTETSPDDVSKSDRNAGNSEAAVSSQTVQ